MTLDEKISLALQHGVDVRGRNAGFQLSHFAATPGDARESDTRASREQARGSR
jgi:hypothetical protein